MPDYTTRSGHPQLRAYLLARYIPGVTLCWRCGQPITTLRTRDIHLGHDDDNAAIWRGLEHCSDHCVNHPLVTNELSFGHATHPQ